jgi:hypothetical protein
MPFASHSDCRSQTYSRAGDKDWVLSPKGNSSGELQIRG